ncbi:MAG: hypothetical protein Alis3KO_25640 [Aliiglaciecola sp.]
MDKSILIHVGPPKSGTSAIQFALNLHRNSLKSDGILYPEHEIGPNGISSGNLSVILDMNDDGKWVVSKSKLQSLMEAFEESKLQKLLLSSEYFFYLIPELAEVIPTAKFIAYIRCPMETYESAYNQSVKRHGRTQVAQFGKNLHTTTLDILQKSMEEVEKDRFVLRAYLPAHTEDFDLVEDFFKALSFNISLTDKHVTNTSYSYEALETKRWFNQFDLGPLEKQLDQILQSYSSGTVKFSLLPETLFTRYRKQSLQYLKHFFRQVKVANAKKLLGLLSEQKTYHFKEQNLKETEFIEVAGFIESYSSTFYQTLLDSLKTDLPIDRPEFLDYLVKKRTNTLKLIFDRILSRVKKSFK